LYEKLAGCSLRHQSPMLLSILYHEGFTSVPRLLSSLRNAAPDF
jgi:hypothetical protein